MRSLLGAAVALATSCVTGGHRGTVTDVDERKILVSCARDAGFDTPAYQALICTVSNETGEPLTAEIKEVRFEQLTPDAAVPRLIDRLELAGVVESYRNVLADNAATMRFWGPVAAGLVAGVGVGLAARSSGGSQGQSAMAGAIAGAGTSLLHADEAALYAGDIERRGRETTGNYERHHVLGGAFLIPAKMYVQRYLVLRLDQDEAWPERLALEFVAPREETVRVSLRDPYKARQLRPTRTY